MVLPYFDDLYLDVVLLSSGKVYVLDEEELEDAFIKVVMSRRKSMSLAWHTTKWILATKK